MPEKYLAVVLKRIDIDENDRIYIPTGLTAGDIDEETNLLKTYAGDAYKRITDYSDNDESIKGYYFNLLETDSIQTSSDAHREYEDKFKAIRYYTTKIGDSIMIRALDKNEDQRRVEEVSSEDYQATNPGVSLNTEAATMDDDEEESIEINDEMITDAIKDVVWRVVSDQFSPDELIDLRERLSGIKEETDAAIESIELKQDALESEIEEAVTKATTQPKATVPTPTALKDEPLPNNQINIQELFEKVTKVLIAQDPAARRAIVEISRLNDMEKKEYGILLTGDTGVGKTLLMNLISAYINRPFLKIDATQLTAPAYVGRSLEQYLWQLYENCGKNKELAETAIIYFDEIDKKGSDKKSDAGGKSVQDTLLKFIEGTEYVAAKNPQQITNDTSVLINTKDMLIVGSGAFLDVYRKKKDKVTNPIGFRTEEAKAIQEETKVVEPSVDDFVKIGNMTSELMGRLPVIIHLDDLSIESIKRIILESDNSALKQQQDVFAKRGVKLSTKEGYILSIAEQALERKIGARGLNKIIADSTWHAYDTICCEPDVYDEVVLTEETAKDSTNYELVKKKTFTVPQQTILLN